MYRMIGQTVSYLPLIIATTIWGGYVATCLWKWFVVSRFGLPELTMLQAIGIMLTVRYMSGKLSVPRQMPTEEEVKNTAEPGVYLIVCCLWFGVILFFGWVISLGV